MQHAFDLDLITIHEFIEHSKKNEIMETIYINYLNKDKNFTKDQKEFTGATALEDARKWGKENLDNFNMDMINYK